MPALGTSRRLGEIIARHPDFVELSDDKAALAALDPDELVQKAMIAADQGPERRRRALRQFFETETVRIAARDLLGISSLHETGVPSAISGPPSSLRASGGRPGVPMAVIGMGSFGGAEIAYGSDLDVLVVYEGSGPSEVAAAEKAATASSGSATARRPQRGSYGSMPRSARRAGKARSLVASTPSRLPPALGRDLGAPGSAAGPTGCRR